MWASYTQYSATSCGFPTWGETLTVQASPSPQHTTHNCPYTCHGAHIVTLLIMLLSARSLRALAGNCSKVPATQLCQVSDDKQCHYISGQQPLAWDVTILPISCAAIYREIVSFVIYSTSWMMMMFYLSLMLCCLLSLIHLHRRLIIWRNSEYWLIPTSSIAHFDLDWHEYIMAALPCSLLDSGIERQVYDPESAVLLRHCKRDSTEKCLGLMCEQPLALGVTLAPLPCLVIWKVWEFEK